MGDWWLVSGFLHSYLVDNLSVCTSSLVTCLENARSFSSQFGKTSTSFQIDTNQHRCVWFVKKNKKKITQLCFIGSVHKDDTLMSQFEKQQRTGGDHSSAFGRYCLTTLTMVDTSAMAPLPATENTQLDDQMTLIF